VIVNKMENYNNKVVGTSETIRLLNTKISPKTDPQLLRLPPAEGVRFYLLTKN